MPTDFSVPFWVGEARAGPTRLTEPPPLPIITRRQTSALPWPVSRHTITPELLITRPRNGTPSRSNSAPAQWALSLSLVILYRFCLIRIVCLLLPEVSSCRVDALPAPARPRPQLPARVHRSRARLSRRVPVGPAGPLRGVCPLVRPAARLRRTCGLNRGPGPRVGPPHANALEPDNNRHHPPPRPHPSTQRLRRGARPFEGRVCSAASRRDMK